jgi:hypothetical protein
LGFPGFVTDRVASRLWARKRLSQEDWWGNRIAFLNMALVSENSTFLYATPDVCPREILLAVPCISSRTCLDPDADR